MKDLFLLLIFFVTNTNSFSQDKKDTITIALELNSLYVVDVEILSKQYDGICDCSIGIQKTNKCSLFDVKINNLIYQADSSISNFEEIISTKTIIVNMKLHNEIEVGQRYIATLGNTSSKDHLQLTSILQRDTKITFNFKQYAYLTSLLTCNGKRPTIRRNNSR